MPKNRIEKRPDGRYRYRYTDAAGKRHMIQSRKQENRRDFAKRCDAADLMAEAKTASPTHIRTYADLFKAWQKQYQELHCSAGDQRNMLYVFKKYTAPRLGHLDLSEITKAQVLDVLASMVRKNLSQSIVTKARQSISRPFNWATQVLDLPLANPVQGLRVASRKPPAAVRVITPEEYQRFLEAASTTRWRAYFEVLWETGLRPSEALGLKAEDIVGRVIRVRRGITHDGLSSLKTRNAVRDIPITDRLREILDTLPSEGWLFAGRHGERPVLSSPSSSFRHLKLKHGFDFTLYDFRHSFATRMAEAGMQLKALQTIMGHSSSEVTMKYYIGFTPSAVEAARDIMNGFAPNLPPIDFAAVPTDEIEKARKAR